MSSFAVAGVARDHTVQIKEVEVSLDTISPPPSSHREFLQIP